MNWKRKLSSRKFWVAVVGFVTAVLIAANADTATVESVTAIITAGGVLVAYILGESYADGKHGGDDGNANEPTNAIGFEIDGKDEE